MTNYEIWNDYMRDIESPQLYIDFGFYWMISAALQRRVWYNSGERMLCPNQYVILCGPPATGKGRVITAILHCLKSYKYRGSSPPEEINAEETDKIKNLERLFPLGPDSGTVEKLGKTLMEAGRSHEQKYIDSEGKIQTKKYYHLSLAFCLEELSNLFSKDTEAMISFLTQGWDCGDYTRSTIQHGEEVLRRICINFLAGTTPNFLRSHMKRNMADQGYSARTIFIYEDTPRKRVLDAFLDDGQRQNIKKLCKHLAKLSEVCGEVSFTADALRLLDDWYQKSEKHRLNNSQVLNSYYARKVTHIRKLAFACHFAESLEMVVERSSILQALSLLHRAEVNMHLAIQTGYANPLADVAQLIVTYLRRRGPRNSSEILFEFFSELPGGKEDLLKVLHFLRETNQIEYKETKYYPKTNPLNKLTLNEPWT